MLQDVTWVGFAQRTAVVLQEDTISINHNWINGSNIERTWRYLVTSLSEVEHEIRDCSSMDGWREHCQVTSQQHGWLARALSGDRKSVG